ncbi:hypothetical protein OEZ85_013922 [Tetradesmus obliquus]|uniref:Uncharacterized protein n=1 Tax=Tetradesmus obliquus TaxID=3088 RepID=A0ABY8U9C7_TETOB|nr:hypothetical protein OEZ85_013922 [Tetradesmus obliquus]
MAGDREALAALKRLSEADLELFDSQPALCSTVEAWLQKRLEHDESNKICDVAGVSSLISDQQVVQLLSAAVTTLLKGLAVGTADSYFPENQMNAFQQLVILHVSMQGDLARGPQQQRQAGAAKGGAAVSSVRTVPSHSRCLRDRGQHPAAAAAALSAAAARAAARGSAAAAAAQLQQQLGGAAGVRELLQLMLQQAGPVVIAAYKRGKLVGALRREDEAGAVKSHSRSVSIQGYGGALISLVSSVDSATLAAALTAGQQQQQQQQQQACCSALKALEASYRDACSPGPDQYLHPLHEDTLRAFGSRVIAALRRAAGMDSSSSSSTAAAAAAAGASGPLVELFCAAMQQQQQQGGASAAGQDEEQQQLLKRLYSLLRCEPQQQQQQQQQQGCGPASAAGVTLDGSGSTWLAARGVTAAVEMHMSLNGGNAAGLAALIRSSTDAREKAVAQKPDAPLQRLLKPLDWLVGCFEQHQQQLGVPDVVMQELRANRSYVVTVLPYALQGMAMRADEAIIRSMASPASVGAAEMTHLMHRTAMPILAWTPHAYACDNPEPQIPDADRYLSKLWHN